MKTILSVMMSIMLALFISACDSSSPDVEKKVDDETEQVIDDATDTTADDSTTSSTTNDARVITNNGDTITDTYNVGLDTYAQYIYDKSGEFNITVTAPGTSIDETLVSYTKTTDTNYLHTFLPYTKVDGDKIDVQAFENIDFMQTQTKLLSFTINNFSETNPTTGTFTSDVLLYKSGGLELFLFSSYDIEVTSVTKDGNTTSIVGSINNVVISTPYDGDYNISIDFDMDASLFTQVFK